MPSLFGYELRANRVRYEGTDEYNPPQFEPSRAIKIGPNLSTLKFCSL